MKKKIFFWATLLISIATISFTSCSSDDEDDFVSVTVSDILGGWHIKSITGDNTHSWLKVGGSLIFEDGGYCYTNFYMEDRYRIEKGKICTYYHSSGEPMFVYAVISKNGDTMKVRMSGTLDDNTSLELVVQKISVK